MDALCGESPSSHVGPRPTNRAFQIRNPSYTYESVSNSEECDEFQNYHTARTCRFRFVFVIGPNSLLCAAAKQHHFDGVKDNVGIEQKSNILDVVEIKLELDHRV